MALDVLAATLFSHRKLTIEPVTLRNARQGDPGSTRYFLSLEDNLFRIFGGEKIRGLMSAFQVSGGFRRTS